MCFYQRLYEWVGLLEHHPKLFAAAERLEERHGSPGPGRTSLKVFTLQEEGPIGHIRSRAAEIFDTRRAQLLKTMRDARQAEYLGLADPADGLHLTSCGIYCGK